MTNISIAAVLKDLHKYIILTLILVGLCAYADRCLTRELAQPELVLNTRSLRFHGVTLYSRPSTSKQTTQANPARLESETGGVGDRSTAVQPTFKYVPPEGNVTITAKDKTKTLNDVVEIKYQWYGVSFEPGLTLNPLHSGWGLDAKVFFVGRFGSELGISHLKDDLFPIVPNLGLSYRLDRIKYLRNTEIKASYEFLSKWPYNLNMRLNF